MPFLVRKIALFTKFIPSIYKQFSTCLALNITESQKRPLRHEVINWLLDFTKERRYLEIGVRDPASCFAKIQSDCKFSVDPGLEVEENLADFPMTSDQFFEGLRSSKISIPANCFDVIFIDGLHLADQAYRDILNSLEFIATPGFLVLHDCNPGNHHFARENYHELGPAGGIWNGTTWKAIQRFRTESDKFCCVIDSDWGIGVIASHIATGEKLDAEFNPFYEFNRLLENRKTCLNLKSYSTFKNIILENHKAT